MGYYHLSTLNKNGAIGLFTKCINKLTPFTSSKLLPIDISLILFNAKQTLAWLKLNNNLKKFNWNNFIPIEIKLNG